MTLRDFLAGFVTQRVPGLLYYLADKTNRAELKLRISRDSIEVLNPVQRKAIRIARANAVYIIDMINYFEYYFSSTLSIPFKIDKVVYQLVDFSTPRMQKINGFDDFPIMSSSLTEPYITTQQYLDFAQIQPGQVVIDLGSYSGLTSIAFSKAVGATGKVIALEPDPINFSTCQINLKQHKISNHLDNITLINAAVSDSKASLQFSAEGSMGASAASVVGNFRGEVISVDCLTLGDIALNEKLDRVDFVKMDIEGYEEKVIRSSEEFFRKFRPKIIIEPHIVNEVLSDRGVIEVLTSYGYRCKNIEQIGVGLPLVIAEV